MRMNFRSASNTFRSKKFDGAYKRFVTKVKSLGDEELFNQYNAVRVQARRNLIRRVSSQELGGDCTIASKELTCMDVFNNFGIKYESQFLIGNHLVDFYLPEFNVAVEPMGKSHDKPRSAANDSKVMERLLISGRVGVLSVTTKYDRADVVVLCNTSLAIPRLSEQEQKENLRLIACSVLYLHDSGTRALAA